MPRTFPRNAIAVEKWDISKPIVPIQHEPNLVPFVPVSIMNYAIVPSKLFALIAVFPDTFHGAATSLVVHLRRLFAPFAFKRGTPN